MGTDRRDVAVAAVLAVAIAVAALLTGPAALVPRIGSALVPAALLVLAARRRRPLLGAAVVAVVVVVEVVAAPQGTAGPSFLAVMLAAYSLAAHARPGAAVLGIGTCLATVAVGQYQAPSAGYSHAAAIAFLSLLLVLGPAAAGRVVRGSRTRTRRLRREAAALREAAPAVLDQLRAEDHRRIRAEIDRVVVDGMAAMRPHAAAVDLAEVVALRDLGRAMLARMRQLLTELRSGEQEPPMRPGSGVEHLRSEVDRVLRERVPAAHSSYMDRVAKLNVDAALVVVAGVYALLAASIQLGAGLPVLACLLAAGVALPAGGVRRWPVPMTLLCLLAGAAFAAVVPNSDPLDGIVPGVALLLVPLLAAATGGASAWAVLALCAGYPFAVVAGYPQRGSDWLEAVQAAVVVAGVWAAGRVLRACGAALADSAQAAQREAAQQRTVVAQALETERAHVARELHDAVGHAMTSIVMLATAAARVWDTDPGRASTHLAALRGTLAQAMDELGPLVESVSVDQPRDLSAVSALVDRVRASGHPLRLSIADIESTRADGAIAYRVVQEALTNAVRHAPGAAIDVRITASAEELTVRIANGASPRPAEVTGTGHGLRGMAERVHGRGGSLHAGPTGDGGFLVQAVIPRQAGT